MINFRNITKTFKPDFLAQPFHALSEVSFHLPEGSMIGFLGANGAGKTTSLKIIMDFIRPTEGAVEFDKCLGTSKKEIFKNIGFLPERPYFYPNLKGEEFLHFMGTLSELSREQIKTEVNFWAPRFKIDHALKRELKTYSKGMLQRIGFLATILHKPKLIILDEPLSGLDPIGRKELKDVIIEVHRQGRTVFFSSHIVSDIEEICDRVIFLNEGKLVYDGSVGNLISHGADSDYVISAVVDQNLQSHLIKSEIRLPENLINFTVSTQNKDPFLRLLMEKNAQILKLEMIKPSLEEIFYKTRAKS